MPSLSFVLPHWLYWAGLFLFPAIALYLVDRQMKRPPGRTPTLFVSYLFLVTAGFLGIHRFYLRSRWGFAFIPVFIALLYCNAEFRDVRDDVSRTFAARQQAQTELANARADAASSEEARSEAAKDESSLKTAEQEYAVAKAVSDHWYRYTQYAALVLLFMLVADAILLPRLVARRTALERANPEHELAHAEPPVVHEAGTAEDPTLAVHTRLTDAIEWVNVRIGTYCTRACSSCSACSTCSAAHSLTARTSTCAST
jgi:hypothetical protein